MVDADHVHGASVGRAGGTGDAFDARRIAGSAQAAAGRCRAMTTTSTITPAVRPYVAHESEPHWYGNCLFEFLVPNDATSGRLTVFRATMPEGFSPPRHIHTREDEVFLVLEGEARFDLDGEQLVAGPGTSVFMPRGVPHSFRVLSPVAVLLGIMTPGAFEELFRNLGVAAAERTLPAPGVVPFDVERVMAEQMRLGTQVVGPPLGP
jgi:quercetin dioxygenase-like cupin family protein